MAATAVAVSAIVGMTDVAEAYEAKRASTVNGRGTPYERTTKRRATTTTAKSTASRVAPKVKAGKKEFKAKTTSGGRERA